jgi:hypothetical protein
MSNHPIASKIDLIQEQIDNLEKSGFFTEKEMDKFSFPLRQELISLKKQLTDVYVDEAAKEYGLTPSQMVEGRRVFSELWAKIDALKNPIFNIEVIEAQILTPNHITV